MELKLIENTLILGKINGQPWWPAYITSIQANKKFEIEFFGDFNPISIKINKIKLLDDFTSLKGKRSKKRIEALRIASKIRRGESNIQLEKHKFQLKSLNLININKNSSKIQKTESSKTQISDVLKFQNRNFLMPFSAPKMQINQTNSNISSRKYKIRKTTTKRCSAFMETFSSNFNSEKKMKNDRNIDRRLFNQKDMSRNLSISLKSEHEIKTNSFKKIKNLKPKSIVENPEKIPELLEISELQFFLKEILATFNKKKINLLEISEKINFWISKFLENQNNIFKMFDGKIGSLLMKVKQRLYNLSTTNFNAYTLYEDVLVLIETVKSAISQQFFKSKVDLDNISLMILSSPIKKSQDFKDFEVKIESPLVFQKKNVRKIFETGKIKENHNFEKNRHVSVSTNHDFIDPEIVFKVCKTLANGIHKQMKGSSFGKKNIEVLATRLEEKIRENTEQEKSYKKQICKACKMLPAILTKMSMEVKNKDEKNFDRFLNAVLNSKLVF